MSTKNQPSRVDIFLLPPNNKNLTLEQMLTIVPFKTNILVDNINNLCEDKTLELISNNQIHHYRVEVIISNETNNKVGVFVSEIK